MFSTPPKVRPKAMLCRRAIRATQRRQVNRVVGVVPGGASISFPPQIEQRSLRGADLDSDLETINRRPPYLKPPIKNKSGPGWRGSWTAFSPAPFPFRVTRHGGTYDAGVMRAAFLLLVERPAFFRRNSLHVRAETRLILRFYCADATSGK